MKRILLKLACSLCFLIHAQAQNGAPSTWLWYQDNGAGNILTNDVYVPSAGSTLYTYYCTLQFNSGQDGGGYCGIQNHPNGYNFIFSIWDPSNHQVITTHYLGNGTLAQNFGGEGTGLKTWNFSLGWATDSWITNALRRWDYNGHTYYGYWINKRSGIGAGWYHLTTMDFPMPSIYFSSQTGSFVEDWNGSGQNIRGARFTNGYKRLNTNTWLPYSSANFSSNAPTTDAYAQNFQAGVDPAYYWMNSGGNLVANVGHTATFNRSMNTSPPDPAIQFTIDSLSKTLVSWTVPITSTPQYSYSIFVNGNQISTDIDPEKRSVAIVAQAGDVIKVTLEDIYGKTTSVSASIPGNPPAVLTSGAYYIQSVLSGKYLYPKGGSSSKNSNIVQHGTKYSASVWNVTSIGNGVYKIINAVSGLSFDILNGSLSASANLVQNTFSSTRISEKFTIPTSPTAGIYNIKPATSTYCLDVKGSSLSDNTVIIQYPTSGNINQQWRFVPKL